jgi:hypothetical protein
LPASSISAAVSWGVYIASAFALLLLLGPILGSIPLAVNEKSGSATVESLVLLVDSLSPGMTVIVRFGPAIGGANYTLQGHTLTFAEGAEAFQGFTRPLLQNATVEAGSLCRVWLASGIVHVANLV